MRKDLNYIIDHVFLPSKLPQKDDSDARKSASLIDELLAALRSLQAHIPKQERSEWIPCIKMVGNMLELRDHLGGLVAEKVQITLKEMMDRGENKPSFEEDTDF